MCFFLGLSAKVYSSDLYPVSVSEELKILPLRMSSPLSIPTLSSLPKMGDMNIL